MRLLSCILCLFIVPVVVFADYDASLIKKSIEKDEATFQIIGWNSAKNGMAETKLKHTIILVNSDVSSITTALVDSKQAVKAILRCMDFGSIGLAPLNTSQREKIGDIIQRVTKKYGSEKIVVNQVQFEITTFSLSDKVFFACSLRPFQSIKTAEYKGVRPYGIARFLYKVKTGASLKEGVDYLYWSNVSKKEKKIDKVFEAEQLVDGYILYSFYDYSGEESIEFTILVPNTKGDMFLQGQNLRDSCHVFAGNVSMEMVAGGERVFPLFKPVDEMLCKEKN